MNCTRQGLKNSALSKIVPTYGAGGASVLDPEERLKGYRRYVYEAGALDHSGKRQAGVIDNDIGEDSQASGWFGGGLFVKAVG